MFASIWLAKTSNICKPNKKIPNLFVGIGPLHRAHIGIHMIQFGGVFCSIGSKIAIEK
jgi:hypothetical protein